MAFKSTALEYSKAQIDNAGKSLSESDNLFDESRTESLEILNNFRSCHNYPINTFQATLRKKLSELKIDYLVSQRLKRTPSILLKLNRFENMRLSQMQDLGGLRAILPTIQDVGIFLESYKKTKFKHEKKSEKDYILHPKESGYRCYHVVYKYKNRINPNFDGLMIELQVRTKLQHAWAMAVETVGTFLDHSLKSSQGPEEWLTFFALVGNAFSIIEGTNPIPQYAHYSKEQTFQEVKSESARLKVIEQLNAFSSVIDNVETDKKQGSLHLIVLDIQGKEISIRTYPKQAIEEASKDYLSEEASITDSNKKQVVLVSSASIESLKKAYPSYFLDTQEFVKILEEIIIQHN